MTILASYNWKNNSRYLVFIGILVLILSTFDIYQTEHEKNKISYDDFKFKIRAICYPVPLDDTLLNACKKTFVLHETRIAMSPFDVYFKRQEDVVKQVGGRMSMPAEVLFDQEKIVVSAQNQEDFKIRNIDDLDGNEITLRVSKDLFKNTKTKWWLRGSLNIRDLTYEATLDSLDQFYYYLEFKL